VYKARHTLLNRLVALKVLAADRTNQPQVLARFLHEMEAVGALHHPNVVGAIDAGVALGKHYLVMELVDGVDLARLVSARGPLPVADACELIRQAALGLEHASQKGLVHRDIKPSNLMLDRDGCVKLLDLGLALLSPSARGDPDPDLTDPGQFMGTAAYMAPEQACDPHAADIRSDIYSLGCAFYFLLSGSPPFPCKTLYETLKSQQSAQARPLDQVRAEVPAELAAVVARMLAKDPAHRFQTPAEVAQALVPFLAPAGAGSPDAPGSQTRRARPPWKSGVLRLAGGILVLGLVIAWGVGVLTVKTRSGVLWFEGVPEQAEVHVDGAKVSVHLPDRGGRLEIRVPTGRHGVEVIKEGFRTFGEEVDVATGAKAAIRVRLVPLARSESRAPVPPPEKEPESRAFVPLFNGKDTTGWKTHPSQPGNWRVEDGVLIGAGPATSHLYTEADHYKDFHLRAEVKINDSGNGGVYFRAPFGPTAPPAKPYYPLSYEAQLNCASAVDGFRTGSLFRGKTIAAPVRKPPVAPGEWFTLEVIAQGNLIMIKVNGKITASYFEDAPLAFQGHIALQQHDAETRVEFRSIEIKEFRESRPSVSTSPAVPAISREAAP
jgi:hypothetical protein